jgi:hypothetical protein
MPSFGSCYLIVRSGRGSGRDGDGGSVEQRGGRGGSHCSLESQRNWSVHEDALAEEQSEEGPHSLISSGTLDGQPIIRPDCRLIRQEMRLLVFF